MILLFLNKILFRILGSQFSNTHKDDHHISIDNIRASVQSVPSTYRNLTGVTSILSSSLNSSIKSNRNSENTSHNTTPTLNTNNDVSSKNSAQQQVSGNTMTSAAPSSFNNLKFSRRREQSDLNNQKFAHFF